MKYSETGSTIHITGELKLLQKDCKKTNKSHIEVTKGPYNQKSVIGSHDYVYDRIKERVK